MPNYNWSHLSHLQIGRYAEYYVKMELTSHGMDIYTTEVDDMGIDFIVRSPAKHYYEVQVKSISNPRGYVFAKKDKFDIYQPNLFMAIVSLKETFAPKLYLIQATEWQNTTSLLRNRNYEEKKTEPEWGVNISTKNMPLLEQYEFGAQIGKFV